MSADLDGLFDERLVLERAGVLQPVVNIRSETDREIVIGTIAATHRNPTPEEKELYDLAARFTVTRIDTMAGQPWPVLEAPADLDPDTSVDLVERAKAIAWLDARAAARSRSRSS